MENMLQEEREERREREEGKKEEKEKKNEMEGVNEEVVEKDENHSGSRNARLMSQLTMTITCIKRNGGQG